MIGILLAKFKMFVRNPWMFFIMTAMSVVFALILGGSGGVDTINVPVVAEDKNIQESIIGETLDASEAYSVQWLSEEEMTDLVSNGKAEFGLRLEENDYQVVVGVDTPNVQIVEQTVRGAYEKKIQYEQIINQSNATTSQEEKDLEEELQSSMDSPIFMINTGSFRGDDSVVYDNTFQTLFGFTLFFVIYTIAYNVLNILVERTDGVWDRVILSPVKKWEMYVGNLIYSFITGYLQVVIVFLIFRYWVGVDFNGNFVETLLVLIPYVFAIVALSILITGLVKNVAQFNAVVPIVSVSMAMIGGAYWPIEIVQSNFIIALSKIMPITYGMEALNGVAVYGYPIDELLYPISILLLMGVVMTGIGLHLMEKRHV